MAGIREVARYAGVSPSTVSRTLSGAAFVEPETKKRVMDAVAALNYHPNLAARSLKKGGSPLVGLVIPDITNPYFPDLVKHLEIRAAEYGYSLILCDSLGDPERERQHLERLRNLFVDGILYISATDRCDHVAEYMESLPFVVINRIFEGKAPCVELDNADAARQAVRYLLEQGHRRIGLCISDKNRQYNERRLEGCLRALEEFGITKLEQNRNISIVRDVKSDEDACRKTCRLMRQKKRPTALFLFDDSMAYGVYSGIRKCGLHVPEDISVIGFDDIPQARYLDPPLTTIRYPMEELTKTVFEKLQEQIRGDSGGITCLKGQLVIRESVRSLDGKFTDFPR